MLLLTGHSNCVSGSQFRRVIYFGVISYNQVCFECSVRLPSVGVEGSRGFVRPIPASESPRGELACCARVVSHIRFSCAGAGTLGMKATVMLFLSWHCLQSCGSVVVNHIRNVRMEMLFFYIYLRLGELMICL